MPTNSSFPIFGDQGGGILHVFKITGSLVGATFGSAGLDGRGQMLAQIKALVNVQTVQFLHSMADAYVFLQPLTANGSATLVPTTSGNRVTGFTLTGLERDDDTAPLSNLDWYVFVYEYTTTQYVQ